MQLRALLEDSGQRAGYAGGKEYMLYVYTCGLCWTCCGMGVERECTVLYARDVRTADGGVRDDGGGVRGVRCGREMP